ncbi:MAG: FAD-dependent oxidoreductase [Candidatus Bathyarchaeota archaeon]|nr:FAD-dependent oxidoreductase [Candidatus Bathyarchaeota archaeon]
MSLYDVVVIGGGPAGLTAALYTSRARLKTKLITGPTPGGQIALTYNVNNYPGLHEPTTGPELVERLITHATKFGAELDRREATVVDFSLKPYKVQLGSELIAAKTVIVATGSLNRKLGLEAEDQLMGKGVFVCATCDAALYEDLRVVVVGGGDSALQEALDLSKFAEEVVIVHRGDDVTGCQCLKTQAQENPKIRFIFNTVVTDIIGEEYVEAVKLMKTPDGVVETFQTDGVLVAIGWDPNTGIFKGQLELDADGNIVSDGVKTGKPGIFVAGDLNDRVYRQVVTACASGCMAAIEAERYLTQKPD